jgi:hypothetical protein
VGGRPSDRLSRFELLGAWLGLWTAPRDVEVPPVPWRRIAVVAAVLVAAVGIAAAVLVPADRGGAARRA